MIEASTIRVPFDLKQIDKTDWQMYRFDQIALNISERVEPQETDLEIYVGLEHLDSESVHIKRWGKPSDVEGTKLKVYPGDVIFGKRRAYQRKAALATFEGICSAHAMVLRANPEVIEPHLFPFFLHSDAFMHRAVDISVGSLSPTINWKTLAVQEFLLPSKRLQAKLAELLWAGDAVVESLIKLININLDALRAYRKEHFSIHLSGSKTLKGVEIAQIITKGASPKWQGFEYSTEGMLFITSENVGDGFLDLATKKYLPLAFHDKLKNSQLKKGDILINIVGASIGRACVFDLSDIEANVNQAVCVLRPKEKVNPYYILNYLLTDEILNRLLISQSSTARANLTLTDIREFDFIVPDKSMQDAVVKELKLFAKQTEDLEYHIGITKRVLNQITNQIFS